MYLWRSSALCYALPIQYHTHGIVFRHLVTIWAVIVLCRNGIHKYIKLHLLFFYFTIFFCFFVSKN